MSRQLDWEFFDRSRSVGMNLLDVVGVLEITELELDQVAESNTCLSNFGE
jgi:hypothetical protein